jgi:cellulose synthase/poly-beta-1,6-N-acetylglucosamine synthase-like glycosyltransferase
MIWQLAFIPADSLPYFRYGIIISPFFERFSDPMLSVIIPIYNEIHTIEKMIDRVAAVKCDKEIIAVDDGSTDGTRQVLARLLRTLSG